MAFHEIASSKSLAPLQERPSSVLPPEELAIHLCKHAASLREIGCTTAAILVAERALALSPVDGRVCNDLASLYVFNNQPDKALPLLDKALKLAPQLQYTIRHNLALALMYSGQHAAALKQLELVQNNSTGAKWDFAAATMLAGHWEAGWREMECRREKAKIPTFKNIPTWDGTDVDGDIWVFSEQGLGDVMQFARYLPLLKSKCKRVIFSTHSVLMPIFYGYPGVDELRLWDLGVPLPDVKCCVPLLSLPYFFKTKHDTVPPDPGHFLKLAKQSNAVLTTTNNPEAFRVGIAWAGSTVHARDHQRSIPFLKFAPLVRDKHTQLFSFQHGERAKDLETHGFLSVIVDLSDKLKNWHVTAGGLSRLDLLVTVDTAVAHMAGALDVPTLLLLPKVPDWRWGLQSSETPWYPSMKLMRQKKLGDWDWVIEEVALEIEYRRKRSDAKRSYKP
jgi:hypothetical protein